MGVFSLLFVTFVLYAVENPSLKVPAFLADDEISVSFKTV